MCVVQVADFANRTASGALTAVVSAEVERLRTQHADAVREKSAADSKCRKLADKVAALEGEKADLRRQLAGERRETNEALVKAQAAQAEANLAQADEDFERDIYKVEDPVVKESAEAIYDRMWGPHGREVVRERAETARAQVTFSFVWRLLDVGCACVC
jgi:chromosome segregation ATPase